MHHIQFQHILTQVNKLLLYHSVPIELNLFEISHEHKREK